MECSTRPVFGGGARPGSCTRFIQCANSFGCWRHAIGRLGSQSRSFDEFEVVGLTLNNSQNSVGYLVWIAGGIIMICTLVTLVRTVNEPAPSQL